MKNESVHMWKCISNDRVLTNVQNPETQNPFSVSQSGIRENKEDRGSRCQQKLEMKMQFYLIQKENFNVLQ